jgi:hypothetical protein
MTQLQQQIAAEPIAKQCSSKLNEVTFPDLATRQLFEKLIEESSSPALHNTAEALAQQKLL